MFGLYHPVIPSSIILNVILKVILASRDANLGKNVADLASYFSLNIGEHCSSPNVNKLKNNNINLEKLHSL